MDYTESLIYSFIIVIGDSCLLRKWLIFYCGLAHFGADSENRTHISSLEGWSNSRYTISANIDPGPTKPFQTRKGPFEGLLEPPIGIEPMTY
jgi:hypothetical protein